MAPVPPTSDQNIRMSLSGETPQIHTTALGRRHLIQQMATQPTQSSETPRPTISSRTQAPVRSRSVLLAAMTQNVANPTLSNLGSATLASHYEHVSWNVADYLRDRASPGSIATPVPTPSPVVTPTPVQLTQLETQFSRTDTFNDQEVRSAQLPQGRGRLFGTARPIIKLAISELTKSLCRLFGRINITIGNNPQAVTRSTIPPSTPSTVTTQNKEMIKTLLRQINTTMGWPYTEAQLEDKATRLAQHANANAEDLQPFTASNNQLVMDNRDIMVLKFMSKEYAAYGVVPLYNQLSQYSTTHNINPPLTIRLTDQVTTVNVSSTSTGFQVISTMDIAIRQGSNNIATIPITLTTNVNSTTGATTVAVQRGAPRFAPNITSAQKLLLFDAINAPLPQFIQQRQHISQSTITQSS